MRKNNRSAKPLWEKIARPSFGLRFVFISVFEDYLEIAIKNKQKQITLSKYQFHFITESLTQKKPYQKSSKYQLYAKRIFSGRNKFTYFLVVSKVIFRAFLSAPKQISLPNIVKVLTVSGSEVNNIVNTFVM